MPTAGVDPTRLFRLDDHEIVRRGLRDLVQGEADVEVVGLDARLLDGDGIEVCRCRSMRHPQVRALILTEALGDQQSGRRPVLWTSRSRLARL